MDDSEVSRTFWQAETSCQDCYDVRAREQPEGTVYISPTPEKRTENALNALQRIIDFSMDGHAEKAIEAIMKCMRCLKNVKPEGPLIAEYIRRQML